MRTLYFILLLLAAPYLLHAKVNYSTYFENSSLRIDYLLGGTDSSAAVFIEQMKKEPFYGGSHTRLIDEQDYGTYRYRVFDLKSGGLIFLKGFCPLFQEWQTTGEAKEMKRSYYQAAVIPFPKNEIRFTIEYRDWEGKYRELLSLEINPDDYFILREALPDYEVKELLKNGRPDQKVDVVFLPEGYTRGEMQKFMADAERMVEILFSAQPFSQHKQNFNIYAVNVPSLQSGTDIPGENIYRNTAFGSTFYTFDTPRYLTTKEMKPVYDAAALVPYDHICVLVNSEQYGGGGFYNFLTITTVDHEKSPEVMVHEFGHGFAGLADEYYSSAVAYDEFYNKKLEPWEPNITTLVNFDDKWNDLIDSETPVPTPREAKFSNKTGVFEGGGYSAQGIYSPVMNCRMKSNEAKGFCPVCARAIEQTIRWHCE